MLVARAASAREHGAPVRDVARNPPLLCAFHGLQMSLFPIAVITLYWQAQLGMSASEMLLLQGLFGLAVALVEFPSGYAADRLGYRNTLLLGSALNAAGWAVYACAETFAHAVVAEALLGVGLALISGTDSALLFESLREKGEDARFRVWDGRFRFFGQISEAAAALCAGLLYAVAPWLPFLVQALVWCVGAGIAFVLREPARHLPTGGGHVRRVVSMVGRVFGGDRRLAAIVALTIALGLSSFVPVWLVPLYARDAGVPVTWLGPIWAVANAIVAVASLASDRVASRFGLVPTLAACVVLVGAGYAGLALSFGTFGFAFYFLLTLQRGLCGPALLHEEQHLVPSSDRAGFLSLRSLLFRLGFLALSGPVGRAVDAHGQHTVLLVLGASLTAAALLAWCAVARLFRRPAVSAA